MLGFRKLSTLENLASVHGQIYNHFNGELHLNNRQTYKKSAQKPFLSGGHLWGRTMSKLDNIILIHVTLTVPNIRS